jgi:hypothetical protein
VRQRYNRSVELIVRYAKASLDQAMEQFPLRTLVWQIGKGRIPPRGLSRIVQTHETAQ